MSNKFASTEKPKCQFIITRGKNKGCQCTRNAEDGEKYCVMPGHKDKAEKAKCKYVNTRGKNIGLMTCRSEPPEGFDFCSAHNAKKLATKKRQDAKDSSDEEQRKIDQARRDALLLYKQLAGGILFNNMKLPGKRGLYNVIDYANDDIVKPNGSIVHGPCCDFDYDVKNQCHVSHMGSGKTHKLVEMSERKLKENPEESIIIISSRISLGNSIHSKLKFLGFVLYSDDSINVSQCSKLIIQAESLYKLYGNVVFGTVFIDECFSLRHQMYSFTTHRENITYNQKTLKMLLHNSNQNILLDADCSEPMLDFYQRLSGAREPIPIHRNAYVNPKKPTVKLYCGEKLHIYEKITNDIIMGLNVTFVTNSKAKGHLIIDTVRDMLRASNVYQAKQEAENSKPFNYVYYNSNNPFPVFEKDDGEMYTVNDDFVSYQFILYSPTITQGVDFTKLHVDRVYGYYSNMSNNVFQFLQMLRRIRYVSLNEYIIYVASVLPFEETDYFNESALSPSDTYPKFDTNYIKKAISSGHSKTRDMINHYLGSEMKLQEDIDGYLKPMYDFEDVFMNHYIKVKHENELSHISADVGLMMNLLRQGFLCPNEIQFIPPSEQVKLIQTAIEHNHIDTNFANVKKLVKSTKSISEVQYDNIKKLTKSGLVPLKIHSMKLTQSQYNMKDKALEHCYTNGKVVKRSEFVMTKLLYEKRKYQLEVSNKYHNTVDGNVKNTISNKLLLSVMYKENERVMFIKNMLTEIALEQFMSDNNMDFGQMSKFMVFADVRGKKCNLERRHPFSTFQKYFLVTSALRRAGLDIFITGNKFTKDDITDKLIDAVERLHNQIHNGDNSRYKKIESMDDFMSILEKTVSKWTGYVLDNDRKTDNKNTARVYYFREPFQGFNEYIICCNTTKFMNDVIRKYNKYKEATTGVFLEESYDENGVLIVNTYEEVDQYLSGY
jgi:hypothetical protein